MAKELTDTQVVEILDKYRDEVENFKRYLTILLEETPVHTIVIFDKIYGEEYKDVEWQLINPHQVLSGTEEVNENTFLHLIWTLYKEFKESERHVVDAVLPVLEKLNAMAISWREAHKDVMRADETEKKQKEFRMQFKQDSLESNRGVISVEEFPERFANLCRKYGMRCFAIYSKYDEYSGEVMAGYYASDVLEESSLQFTQIFAALCENERLGDCLARAFGRFYKLMHKYEAEHN